MNISVLLSILFYFSCIISAFLGVYCLYVDPKANLNRTFFALCISLSLWAIGFSLGIRATDLGTCIFWRRISALGWGSMYSILLHFFLILTRKENALKKWWVYLVIYLPAIIIIDVFAISNRMALFQYHLVKTSFGWTNKSVNNGWDWFFNIYYISYMLGGLGMVGQWGKFSDDKRVKKQATLLVFSFFVAFFMGTLTDIICNSFLSLNIPQMAPLIILFPISVIYFSIMRYGLMKQNRLVENEAILNESTRTKGYNYLSIIFGAASIVNFIIQYYHHNKIHYSLYSSAFVLLLGIAILIIKRLKIDEYLKDIFLIIIISIAIPSITLIYIQLGIITVWASSFIFIIMAMLFNKRIVLTSISVSILSTQVLVWILKPAVITKVDKVDFLGRIGIFGIAIWLAFYVNKIYIMKLKENADQIRIQKMIAAISSDFVAINQMNINEKIGRAIEKIGESFLVDQICFFLFDMKQNKLNLSHEWHHAAIKAERGTIQDIQLDVFPWWKNLLLNNAIINIPDVERLPNEASAEKKELKKQHIQSSIIIPIVGNEKFLGFLRLDSIRSIRNWPHDHTNIIKIIANIFADALIKVEAEKEINYLAYYDHLTKLPNRSLFKDRVHQAIQLATRTGKMVGVIFVDIDSFKTVNDTMGHQGGDELLIKVAAKLSQCIRTCDTVSRFGGDEFLVMINNIATMKDIVKIAEDIIDLFKQPYIINGQEFFITISAGIAVYPADGQDTDALIKNADIAMYNAKEKGKNQYMLCTSDLKDEIKTKMKLTNSLYRALERNELQIYYQPQIDLQSGKIIALEALLRWNHPELGMVSPGMFIPLAEQTGLINPIGEWVLRTACQQNKVWQNMGPATLRMAVNVSVNQFRNPNFIRQVESILRETDLNPAYLELEITENIAIQEDNYIIDVLRDLKQLGVSISIDDFGTGYSSLTRLKMLPIDRIKLDMQFVRGIEENVKDKAIAKVIINLAKNLGLHVIAEGVETKQQLEFLSQWECNEVQGFYYYKPMPANEFETILSRR